jgi:hypothetical protein
LPIDIADGLGRPGALRLAIRHAVALVQDDLVVLRDEDTARPPERRQPCQVSINSLRDFARNDVVARGHDARYRQGGGTGERDQGHEETVHRSITTGLY